MGVCVGEGCGGRGAWPYHATVTIVTQSHTYQTIQVYRKIAKCWVGHSKIFYWLRGSRMVQNVEKTAKKISDFFQGQGQI